MTNLEGTVVIMVKSEWGRNLEGYLHGNLLLQNSFAQTMRNLGYGLDIAQIRTVYLRYVILYCNTFVIFLMCVCVCVYVRTVSGRRDMSQHMRMSGFGSLIRT